MKFNIKLKAEIEEYKSYTIIVEGQKDVLALKSLGFEKVYAIHKTSITLKERVGQIAKLVGKKEKVCILTDLDKRGRKLYSTLKSMFPEHGIKLDSTLRGILIKSHIPHIEGFYQFLEKVKKI